ncbi:MAG: LOW QUALITY PROTEIN: non-SMC mitotic condensation complex subunit 1-domain-containing protein [Benniella sp.]|nr:MAG: LOW QUALITY PROTEIN: non-SMC mitotic condensation complex subunit 1-domain-containing protein [Benniella sp.]
MSGNFELDEELNNIQQDSVHIPREISIEGEHQKTLERILNEIVDTLHEASGNITDSTIFDQIRSFIKHFNILKKTTASKVWDILLSGFNSEITSTAQDLDINDQDVYMHHREPLEMYGFLIFWVIGITEQKATSRATAAEKPESGRLAHNGCRGKGSRTAKDNDEVEQGTSTWTAEKQKAMELMSKCLELQLSKIWTATHEKETFISLFFKPAYQILENKENINIIALSSGYTNGLRHTHEGSGQRPTILQNLHWRKAFYRECSCERFDESIKDLSLSEVAPKLVLKQMGLLIDHLDESTYTMRQAIIGNLIAYLSEAEQTDQVKKSIDGFFDVRRSGYMDNNSYVLTNYCKLQLSFCDLRAKFPNAGNLVIGRLSDKSFWSRKQAIKTLVRLIETHPYSMHGGELDIEEWDAQYTQVTGRQPRKTRVTRGDNGTDMEVDDADRPSRADNDNSSEYDDDVERARDNDKGKGDDISLPTDEELLELQSSKEYVTKTLQQRYYADAIRFVHLIHRAVPVMCQLIASTNEAGGYGVLRYIHRYKSRVASESAKWFHLVGMKDNGDEAKSVRNIALIARNLVSLTYGSTLAELTSLEQLLSTIVADSMANSGDITISDEVVEKLWQVYSHNKEIPNQQRRGAIIILGMLAKAKPDIVAQKIETILKIGLGKHGKADHSLARYSCIALQRIAGEKKKQKGVIGQNTVRLPMSHPIFVRLSNLIDYPTTSKNWFAMAEQALNTIYLLGEHPDILCGDIIKARCKTIFHLQEPSDPSEDQMAIDAPAGNQSEEATTHPENAFTIDSWQLSQLLFIVGHVAIKHIVHMEVIEEEFKRRKTATGNEKKKGKDAVDDELDQVVGTTEDEFGDAMAHIRERELLFGEGSLLQVFGPLIVNICGNNTPYNDKTLQSSATLALCKMMCPTVRSNIIIALGDMAVCFNNLIDANIAYLYKRLSDSDTAVKKNTLMCLHTCILNGMVKVKGQLGEMAICLVDEDARISDLARLFFTELTSKDNAVYNNMPDIISHMSNANIDEESYRKIMRFLFELIKENMESMTEKLCQRFKNTDEPRGWRDIAFCLSMLPFKTEKSFKRLLEGFPNYQDKVHEEQVFKYLSDIIAKGRAIKPPKPEMKPIIDEFESKLKEAKAKGDEVQETEAKAISAVKKGTRKSGRRAGTS